VSAGEFVAILAGNGIRALPLGAGFARVRTSFGKEERVAGALVAAILSTDLRRAQEHAKLCGVSLAPLEIEGCTSRANVL
jgi:hypothetical protein